MKPFLFLSVFLSSTLSAQLSGIVADQPKQGLAFASVSLFQLPDTTFLSGTTTDDYGYFLIATPQFGPYQVRIEHLGYQEYVKDLEGSAPLDLGFIQLKPTENNLAEVIVRGKRQSIEQRKEALWFNVAQSPLRTGYDGMEVLERSPNVWLTDEGGILLRNEPALVLINGRPLRLEGEAMGSYLRSLNSENILRIEVRPNAGAEVSAAGAGGTINIILKRPTKGVSGTLLARYLHRGTASKLVNIGPSLNYGGSKWNVYGNYDFVDNKRWFKELSTTNYLTTGNFLNNEQIGVDSFYRHNYRIGAVVEPFPSHVIGGEFFRNTSVFSFAQNNDLALT
ncbi:MAG: carboxypeptidase-like regulatory domain-containing protein, partial [Bacteroidota bacterium]